MGIKKTVLHNEYVADDEKLPGRKVSLPIGEPATDYIIETATAARVISIPAGFNNTAAKDLTAVISGMEPLQEYVCSYILFPELSTGDTGTMQFLTTEGCYALVNKVIAEGVPITANVNGKLTLSGHFSYYAKNTTNESVNIAVGLKVFALLTKRE